MSHRNNDAKCGVKFREETDAILLEIPYHGIGILDQYCQIFHS
jgi:hypothetical protein